MAMSSDDTMAYVRTILRENSHLLPNRLSTKQGVELTQLVCKVYRQAFDRGYRVGQEDLANAAFWNEERAANPEVA